MGGEAAGGLGLALASGELAGCAELGFWLGEAHWASVAVLRKLGFRDEGRTVEGGGVPDTLRFGLLAAAWEAAAGGAGR